MLPLSLDAGVGTRSLVNLRSTEMDDVKVRVTLTEKEAQDAVIAAAKAKLAKKKVESVSSAKIVTEEGVKGTIVEFGL